jgi:isopentenyl-diphosphate delta-isomerase
MIGDKLHARGGKTFWNWGISTPNSIMDVGEATDWKLPIIATGGIRNGLDAAKALALGANCAGMAHALLEPAIKSKNATISEVDAVIKEIRATMFLLGVDKVSKMTDVEVDLWI